jgi:hypothetical protein
VKYVRTHKHPFPVHGKGAGDGSLFEICKIIGYRRTLCPKTKLEQKRGIPLPVYGEGERGGGSLLKGAKILAKKSEGAKIPPKGRFYSFQTVGGTPPV